MAFSHVLVTEDELDAMAGENVDATGWVEENKQAWANQAGGFLCALMSYDLITNVGSLTANGKQIFAEYIARYTAMSGIAYNMAGFTSRIEAENMINIHAWRMAQIKEILKNQSINDYIKGA
jgi:hypothetical protein